MHQYTDQKRKPEMCTGVSIPDEKLDNEKSELLHLMYTQKKLFDKIDNNRFSFKKYPIFSYSNMLYIVVSIAFTSYLIF